MRVAPLCGRNASRCSAGAMYSREETAAAQGRHQTGDDLLTGLPNCSLLLDRLSQAISQAARQRNAGGLLPLDVDRFKSVSDERGHAAFS